MSKMKNTVRRTNGRSDIAKEKVSEGLPWWHSG